MLKHKKLTLIIACIVIISLGITAFLFFSNSKKDDQPLYTEYELTEHMVRWMIRAYGITIDPNMGDAENPEDYHLVPLDDVPTRRLYSFNRLVFDLNSDRETRVQEYLKEYGFDKDNPLTEEWVITHPQEALDAFWLMTSSSQSLMRGDLIKETETE